MQKLNLVGERFGRLIVIAQEPRNRFATRWKCRCDCGNEVIVQTNALRREPNGTRSCGCINKETKPFEDLTGKKFHKLTIVSFDQHLKVKGGKTRRIWNVKCDCGTEKKVQESNLFNKIKPTLSCGCHKIQITKDRHARTRTLETTQENFYTAYKNRSEHDFNITEEEFNNIVYKPCHYCKSLPSYKYQRHNQKVPVYYNGIDRIDSNKKYTIDNIVSCCAICNWMKSDKSLDEFKNQVINIYNYYVNKDIKQ